MNPSIRSTAQRHRSTRGDGTAYDVDVITHQLKSAVRKTRVKPIRFHDLRRINAFLLLAAGEHPEVVQERLATHPRRSPSTGTPTWSPHCTKQQR